MSEQLENGFDFDLADLDEQESAELVVRNPRTGEPVPSKERPWTIVLASPSHPASKRADAWLARQTAVRRRRPELQDDDEARLAASEDDAAEWMAMRTLGWRDAPPLHGQPFEYSAENARALYRRFAIVKAQVNRVFMDQAAFLRPSSSSSSATQELPSS